MANISQMLMATELQMCISMIFYREGGSTDYYKEFPALRDMILKYLQQDGDKYNGLAPGSAPLSGKLNISNVAIIPSFSKLETYTIAYNANNGTGAPPSSQTKIYDKRH